MLQTGAQGLPGLREAAPGPAQQLQAPSTHCGPRFWRARGAFRAVPGCPGRCHVDLTGTVTAVPALADS